MGSVLLDYIFPEESSFIRKFLIFKCWQVIKNFLTSVQAQQNRPLVSNLIGNWAEDWRISHSPIIYFNAMDTFIVGGEGNLFKEISS